MIQETKSAELEAQREDQRLQATVRKPADAQAYAQVKLATADRDTRIAAAEAHAREGELQAAANAQRVKLEADAEAEHVRLAAASQFAAVDQMIVLNGAQGLTEALSSVLSQGAARLQMARQMIGSSTKKGADRVNDGQVEE